MAAYDREVISTVVSSDDRPPAGLCLADRARPPAQDPFALALAAAAPSRTDESAGEAGDDRLALWWTGLAIRLAEAGSDAVLGGHANMRRTGRVYRGDADRAVALARQALVDAAAGEADQMCRLTHGILPDARDLGPVTIRHDLQKPPACSAVGPHARQPGKYGPPRPSCLRAPAHPGPPKG